MLLYKRVKNISEKLNISISKVLECLLNNKIPVYINVLETRDSSSIEYYKLSDKLSELLVVFHLTGGHKQREIKYIKQAEKEGEELHDAPCGLNSIYIDDLGCLEIEKYYRLSNLDQIQYSLKEAANEIERKTGLRYSANELLKLAENNKIGICFYVGDGCRRYIRLDKKENRWKSVICTPLFGKHSLKRVVIPTDNKNQENNLLNTIDPKTKTVFPILSDKALLEFADNPEKEIVIVFPWKIRAVKRGGELIDIAIIEYKTVDNSVHAEYTAWQKEHELPTFNVINEERLGGTAIAEGNYNYFETWSTMEIKRSDLCIPAISLSFFIERLQKPTTPEAPQTIPSQTKQIESEAPSKWYQEWWVLTLAIAGLIGMMRG